MLLRLICSHLLRCWHRRVTWPITMKGSVWATVSCLDCGKRFTYDWHKMKVGAEVKGVRA
jgi:hypothetical protein